MDARPLRSVLFGAVYVALVSTLAIAAEVGRDSDSASPVVWSEAPVSLSASGEGECGPFDGYALKFDGVNDQVMIAEGLSDFGKGVTLSAWVRPLRVTFYGQIIDFGNGVRNDNIVLSRFERSDDVQVMVYRGAEDHAFTVGADGLKLGAWQHIAAVLVPTGEESADATIYRNGEAIGTGDSHMPRNVIRTSNFIGRSNWPDLWFAGLIDEVRVWNLPRTGEEIRADMHRDLNGDEPGLVAYWRFDEGDGEFAQDAAGAHDGIVSGATWVATRTGACPCNRMPEWLCDGDVDGDAQVNPVDAGVVQANFGNTSDQALCNYDIDCDGQINPVDAGIVQSLFGTCEDPRNACPAP